MRFVTVDGDEEFVISLNCSIETFYKITILSDSANDLIFFSFDKLSKHIYIRKHLKSLFWH